MCGKDIVMDNRAIGVFDSGLGGLTAVKEIMERLPNENLIYFGDTGRVPYGTRSEEIIVKYSRQDINFLKSFDVKMIVVACGTVSSVALPIIKKECDIPIIGVVEATADAAAGATRNNKIGIIGTQGTISSGAYAKRIHSQNSKIRTYSKACPLFVPLVENGHFDTKVTRLVIEEYLEDIKKQGVDTLILGCTHYPLLEKAIADYMGSGVRLINSGAEVAKALEKEYPKLLNKEKNNSQYRYFVSDDTKTFERLASSFLQCDINGQVAKTDIEKY